MRIVSHQHHRRRRRRRKVVLYQFVSIEIFDPFGTVK